MISASAACARWPRRSCCRTCSMRSLTCSSAVARACFARRASRSATSFASRSRWQSATARSFSAIARCSCARRRRARHDGAAPKRCSNATPSAPTRLFRRPTSDITRTRLRRDPVSMLLTTPLQAVALLETPSIAWRGAPAHLLLRLERALLARSRGGRSALRAALHGGWPPSLAVPAVVVAAVRLQRAPPTRRPRARQRARSSVPPASRAAISVACRSSARRHRGRLFVHTASKKPVTARRRADDPNISAPRAGREAPGVRSGG